MKTIRQVSPSDRTSVDRYELKLSIDQLHATALASVEWQNRFLKSVGCDEIRASPWAQQKLAYPQWNDPVLSNPVAVARCTAARTIDFTTPLEHPNGVLKTLVMTNTAKVRAKQYIVWAKGQSAPLRTWTDVTMGDAPLAGNIGAQFGIVATRTGASSCSVEVTVRSFWLGQHRKGVVPNAVGHVHAVQRKKHKAWIDFLQASFGTTQGPARGPVRPRASSGVELPRARELFEQFAEDDGALDLAELGALICAVYAEEGVQRSRKVVQREVQQAMAHFDLDGDGHLDEHEFIEMYLTEMAFKFRSRIGMTPLQRAAAVMRHCLWRWSKFSGRVAMMQLRTTLVLFRHIKMKRIHDASK